MRILQISDLAPPHIGGIEKVVWRYSKLLKERGHDVTILTSKLRETPSRENFDGVDFIRVPRYILSFPNIYSRNFDIIHTHSYFSFFSLGLEKKFTEKIIIKHVHSVYGEELEEFTGWSFSRIFSGIVWILIGLSVFLPFKILIASVFYIIRAFIVSSGTSARSVISINGIDKEDYGTATSIQGVATRLFQTSSALDGYLLDLDPILPLFFGGLFIIFSGLLYKKIFKKIKLD